MIYGLIGLLIGSGLLTWFTKPPHSETVVTKRVKKPKNKTQLRDAQPYLTEDGFVSLRNRGTLTDSQDDQLS